MARRAAGQRGIVDLGNCWLVRVRHSDNYYVGYSGSGTRRIESLETSDREIAVARLKRFSLELERGETRDPRDVRIEEVLAHYWTAHAQKIASADAARVELRRILCHFQGRTVLAIRKNQVTEFAKALRAAGLSDGSVARTLSTLSAAINRADADDVLDHAPRTPRPDNTFWEQVAPLKGRPLRIAELRAIWRACRTSRERRYLALLMGTLSRPGALLDLSFAQVDRELGVIELNPHNRRQTKKYRPLLPLIPSLRALLPENGSGLVLATESGAPWANNKRDWRVVRERAGLDEKVTSYSIRHTMPDLMAVRKVPNSDISIWLGHQRLTDAPRTTLRYMHSVTERLSESAKVLDAIVRSVIEA